MFILLLFFDDFVDFYGFALARLIAHGTARFASGLTAGLAFPATRSATSVQSRLYDNFNMLHDVTSVLSSYRDSILKNGIKIK